MTANRAIRTTTRRPVRPRYVLTPRGEMVRDVVQGLASMMCMVMIIVTGAVLACWWFGIL